jgi:membrane-associated phospholipid phosphatase
VTRTGYRDLVTSGGTVGGTGRRPRLAARPVWPASWWYDGLAVLAFAALTATLAAGHLLALDVSVRDWVDGHTALASVSGVLNRLGQGGFFTSVCALLAIYWTWRRHSVRPLLPVAMAFALTYVVLTLLKDASDRAAPHADHDVPPVVHPEQFGSGGVSYPSGHLANAFVWYGVLALLLAPWLAPRWRWLLRIAPPVILAFTTVYLGYHWLTDTAAGLLLGFVLWRLIARVPWDDLPLGRFLAIRGWDRPALEAYQRGSPPRPPG